MTATGSEVLTVPEAAAILRVSKMSIYRSVHAKELRAYRVGRLIRIRRDDFEAFMAAADTMGGAA